MTVYSMGGPDLTLADPSRPVTLETMANDLMALVTQSAAQLGVQLPERRVIYMAPMPADCPQVAVLIGGWAPEPEWDGLAVCPPGRWVAQLGVVITRKTPAVPTADGDLPRPSALAQAAHLASQDAEVLLAVVGGLGEIAGDVLVQTPAAEGGLQSATLVVRAPAFGGL
jgi:hypothetical protein